MSKKLIAIAAAAALALTGLVGVAPASANVTIAYTTGDEADGSKSVTPSTSLAAETAATALIDVPALNTLAFSSGVSRNNLLLATVTTVVGQVVSVETTGALKIVDAPTNTTDKKYTSASGTSTFTKTADSTSVTFYVFTTSTSAGTVKTTVGGNSSTIFVKGEAGPAYNITSALPAVIPAAAPSTNNLIAKITDVFGNEVEADTGITTSVTGAGGAITASGTKTYSSTLGGFGLDLHATGTGGMAVSLALTSPAADVTGLAKANKVWYATSSAADLAGQVTTLTAQVTALTAQVAALKTDYNALAKKFNKKVKKKNRVTLK